ncbi:hypothetical protein V8D89_002926 [Ganoderma adspersum]
MDSSQQPPRFKYPPPLPSPDHAKHSQTIPPSPLFRAKSRLFPPQIPIGRPSRQAASIFRALLLAASSLSLGGPRVDNVSSILRDPLERGQPVLRGLAIQTLLMLVPSALLRSSHQTHFYQPSAPVHSDRYIYQSQVSRRYSLHSCRDNSIPWLSVDSAVLAHYTRPRTRSPTLHPDASESQTKHAYRTAAGRRVQQPWRLPPVPVALISFSLVNRGQTPSCALALPPRPSSCPPRSRAAIGPGCTGQWAFGVVDVENSSGFSCLISH